MKTKMSYKRKGFTLVELLIYIAGFIIILTTIIFLMSSMLNIYRQVKVSQELESSLHISMDRIVREVRDAQSVDLVQSSQGNLYLNTTDDAGDAEVVRIYLDAGDGIVYLEEDGVLIGPLTSENVNITALDFDHISTGNSEAVRAEVTGTSSIGSVSKTETFYGAAILRESY